MRKLSVLFLVFLMGLIVYLPASAQSAPRLSSLEVDLWPEYDRPSVLVIYRITLPAGTSLPVDLSFRIPAGAGEPTAVAVRQATAEGGSSLFTIPHERLVSGEWGVITLTATAPELQLEYYDPGLVKSERARQFEYRWPGDYAVDSLVVQVQQPVGASEMQLSPASGAGVPENDGMTYFNKEVGALPAGQTFSLSIGYKKPGDELSASSLQVQPSAPVTSVTPGQNILSAVLPWVLGGVGVLLILGGGAWYWFSGRQKREDKPRRHRHAATKSEPVEDTGGYVYCHQCGKRAAPSDRFCRACGMKLRVE